MKPKYFIILLLTLTIIHQTSSIATIRYVSKTGTSQFPYTSWNDAADSIQKCINICSFGDTVYVANGIYKERIDMIPGLSLIGAGSDSCIVDTRQLANHNYSIRVTDSCYLSGFQTLTYDNSYGNGIYLYDVNIQSITAVVEFMKVTNAQSGFRISSSALNFDGNYKLIKKNIIFEVEIGLGCFLTSPYIQDNIIYPKENGLVSNINSSPTYINNTIIMENGSNTSDGYAPGFHLGSILKDNSFYIYQGHVGISSANDSIINNVVTGNPTYGILTQSGGVVKNNIVKGADTGIRQLSGTTTIKYNNLWENNINYVNINSDTTNINVNPMFVNEDSLNLHLQKYSPLIDAGDPNIIDKDGTRSDIGLYGGPFGEDYKYLDLAPRSPINVTGVLDSEMITIKWNPNTEADFSYYKLYRDTTAGFTADSSTLVISLTDTFYSHIIPPSIDYYYYKLTAVDNQGNESNASEELVVDLTSVSTDDYPMTINDYQLYQNYPNPFNPSTKISYRLKERGYVKLYVYDVKGELVSVLVNQNQEAGFYDVEFTTNNQQPTTYNLASGIYIYQIMVMSENNIPVFSDIKKMVFVK